MQFAEGETNAWSRKPDCGHEPSQARSSKQEMSEPCWGRDTPILYLLPKEGLEHCTLVERTATNVCSAVRKADLCRRTGPTLGPLLPPAHMVVSTASLDGSQLWFHC